MGVTWSKVEATTITVLRAVYLPENLQFAGWDFFAQLFGLFYIRKKVARVDAVDVSTRNSMSCCTWYVLVCAATKAV